MRGDYLSDLDGFFQTIQAVGLDGVRQGLIGRNAVFETPFGSKKLLYADYIASGRSVLQVENFLLEKVLPFYANTHTEASHTGRCTSRLREEIRARILGLLGGGADCHAIFAGAGATMGVHKIISLIGLRDAAHAVVLIGPYEHHSNILPWVEAGADVRQVAEDPAGGLDLTDLEDQLQAAAGADLIVGSFSAVSNVTGIVTPTDPVTRLLRAHGAYSVWDYAGGAPYVQMDMSSGDTAKDAIIFSPHKFVGGPGASGVLLVRDRLIRATKPSMAGGGTVSFVSPWRHSYSDRVEAREEAGTPNITGDIRAGLALLIKHAIGLDVIAQRDQMLRDRALEAWQDDHIEIFGRDCTQALPFFSFRVRDNRQADSAGAYVHHQLVTRVLSDYFGIQARGGCACAGRYAHQLLNIDAARSDALFANIEQGNELEKPGWVRLSLSYIHDDLEAARIIEAVAALPDLLPKLAPLYHADSSTARFAFQG